MPTKVLPIEDRFFSFFKKGKANECWEWRGYFDKDGYGRISKPRETHTIRAHRLSYILHHGPIPFGALVLHSCDNPSCVNPSHLRVGTHQDNMRDRSTRGRQIKGEAMVNAKFTDSQILAIRRDRRSQAEIGKQYGVNQSVISKIQLRRTWSHIEPTYQPKKKIGESHPTIKISSSKISEIRSRRADGETTVSLARDFGVHHSTISKICLFKSRKIVG